jgi:2-polyprenyl-6-methoxyphenol hydroxylase-like FAD-dependent oxidoreductase
MYDVLIVGYGPTGMMAAALLGRAGRRVAVLERYTTLYNLPRVGIVHDDVMRMFQELGLMDRLAPHTYFLPSYQLAHGDEVLLESKVAPSATHGWPEFTSLYQPAFEAELDAVCKALPSVDVIQGCKVVALRQDAEMVEVTADDGRRFQGRYLIGSDGGNSLVREALGVAYEDLGFNQAWLVVDAKLKNGGRPGLPALRQFCDPEQPGMTMQMGPLHRRWSFHIFAGEKTEDAVKHENVWKRLERPTGGTPDEFELIRTASYQFRSLVAERWRVGRAFLAGDSAHQMPPFLAQGLCSGFRDAYNLAWKLDLVLDGKAPDRLLETYQAERGPNARDTVIESARVGINVNERDPEKVRARDAQLRAMQKQIDARETPLIAFRVPGFKAGLIGKGPAAGDSFVQGKVRAGGREGWFDDVAGRGFMILARNAAPSLSSTDRAFWESIGGRVVRFGADIDDGEGRYTKLMDEYGCDVIVKRPDNYIFSACRSAAELPAIIGDLRAQLRS